MTESPATVTVKKADLKYLLDVYINNGMVETEDEEIINRLWAEIVPAWYWNNEGRCPVCDFEAGSEYEADMHDGPPPSHVDRSEP